MKNWKRATHCMAFRNSAKPTTGLTFEADITSFREKVRQQGLSFTMAMIYAVCRTANEIEELRYRFLNGEVVLFDRIDTSFTYLDQKTELFKVVTVPMLDDMAEYCRLASETARAQEEYFPKDLRTDVFQCSAIPWVTYTQLSHTISGKKDNAAPIFDWGKYYEKDGRLRILISIQVHHSFADGLHMARFAEKLQTFLNLSH